MGRSCPLTTEDELMRKVCHLFDSTRENMIREQVRLLFLIRKQLPEFSFEEFVEAWDENDKFIKRLFEFFIKETAMRHFMKKTDAPITAIPQASNNSYGNLVDLALNVATTPRTIDSQASNIHRILQNTIQEDQAARHAWMVSSRNISTPRDRRRFRPQNGLGQQRQGPEDEAATTRIYRTSSASIPNRTVSNPHASLIDHAILDLLPIPSGVVSITHGLPFRRPNRERRTIAVEEEFVRPGQVQFSHIELSHPPQAMNLNLPSEREN